MRTNCGRCHECGSPLVEKLGAKQWCPKCKAWRRYQAHGWICGRVGECPDWANRRCNKCGDVLDPERSCVADDCGCQ